MLKGINMSEIICKESIYEYKIKFGKDSLVHTGILELLNIDNKESLTIVTCILDRAIHNRKMLPQYTGELWDEDQGIPNYDKIYPLTKRCEKLKNKELNTEELKSEDASITAYLNANIMNYHLMDSFTGDSIMKIYLSHVEKSDF